MNILAGAVVVSLGLLVGQAPQAPAESLAAARALYASAAFEEALNRLNAVEASADPIEVAQLRALCWIGLGQTEEAERALEALVWRSPRYVIGSADVSPRLSVMFRDVRERLLPTVANDLLSAARTFYEDQQFAAASERLDELLALISAESSVNPAGGADMSDLRAVAEGLKDLITFSLAQLPGAPEPVVFSSADRDVMSPVEVSRAMPHWTPAKGSVAPGLYQGLLEVVINERGIVESPVMRRPVHPSYDTILLAATTDWRFQPAIRNGEPVRYRKFFEIILHTRRASRQH